MRDHKNLNTRAFFLFVVALVGTSLFIGCSSPKPAAQEEKAPARYQLTGRVVSVEKDKQQVVVDHGEIPGFMMAMTMGYSVKNPSLLDSLAPEDQITSDVVVNGNDVWLENIVVVKKADAVKTPPAKQSN